MKPESEAAQPGRGSREPAHAQRDQRRREPARGFEGPQPQTREQTCWGAAQGSGGRLHGRGRSSHTAFFSGNKRCGGGAATPGCLEWARGSERGASAVKVEDRPPQAPPASWAPPWLQGHLSTSRALCVSPPARGCRGIGNRFCSGDKVPGLGKPLHSSWCPGTLQARLWPLGQDISSAPQVLCQGRDEFCQGHLF